jgi:NAD-dependent dihydropyrimidine dehydrogenase PreA subunit
MPEIYQPSLPNERKGQYQGIDPDDTILTLNALCAPAQTGSGGSKMINRRDFLKNAVKGAAGIALPLAAFEIVNPKKLFADKSDASKVRWVFLVDTYKCVGCGLCVKACKNENEIPYDANVTGHGLRDVMTKTADLRRHPKGAGRLYHKQNRSRIRQIPGH